MHIPEKKGPEISIILPCLNEEASIGFCIDKLREIIENHNLDAEVIIVDNGSIDNSCKIIRQSGPSLKKAKLVHEPRKGYGSAYMKGFEVAQGKYLFMADSDGSYDFEEIPRFINKLKSGYDFVIGNRFKGKIEEQAMPWHHRYIGNPILSKVLKLFFKTKVNDAHCGMRAITKQAYNKLGLKTIGMEFASEMVIQAGKKHLRINEVPINYHKRKGTSKLKSFSDGWRHLRFMLLYSPLFLFFIPGLILFLLGIISMIWIYLGPQEIFGLKFQYHPMFISTILIITGYQLIFFGIFAKTYAITHLGEPEKFNKLYKHITIERASILGIAIIGSGILIYASTLINWLNSTFDALNETKKSFIALTLITLGIQTIFSSFMLSILGIKEK
ncbi:glycosyltransferase family 2 protein [Candidatus Pacearchaeota archaeon]|nr:glycosyltransferase family 2 protein [Candidatus Pacearchaeota archaeon]